MKLKQKLPLLLAAALQVLPLARNVCTLPSTTSTLAIIMRWAVGSAATLGAYDACSGASKIVFTSATNATATVGQPFSFTVTVANFGTDPGAVINAAVIPYANLSAMGIGLTNYTVEVAQQGDPSTIVNLYAIISGTPTVATNNMKINLKATHPQYVGNFQTNLYLTIVASQPPPPSLSVLPAAPGQFRFSFVPITGVTNAVETNAVLTGAWHVLTNIPPPVTASSITVTDVINDVARNYRVRVTP